MPFCSRTVQRVALTPGSRLHAAATAAGSMFDLTGRTIPQQARRLPDESLEELQSRLAWTLQVNRFQILLLALIGLCIVAAVIVTVTTGSNWALLLIGPGYLPFAASMVLIWDERQRRKTKS